MSTYDDASLIYYPSGYKEDKIYSLKPTDGSGDLTFTRASSATRVNAEGLIENAFVLGAELITNGDFATDSDWTKGSGWTISGGTANYDGVASIGDIQQSESLVLGKTYKYSFTISNRTQGGVRFFVGNTVGLTHSANGTFTGYITYSSGGYILLQARDSFIGSIDNVSVKEVITLNVPRIDYTSGCGKLLLEPQRTNSVFYSEDFSNAYWTKQAGITATYNTTETLSPDGTYNATKFVGNGTTGVLKTSISVSGVVSRSVYLKSVTGTTTATFKEPNTNVPSPITLTITNEWQRFEMIGDNGSSFQGLQIDDITSDGIYMWGASLEAGNYVSSYVPTTSTAVTRLAEQYDKVITSLVPDATTFTWEVDFIVPEVAAGGGEITGRNAAGTTQLRLYANNSGVIRFRVESGGQNYDTAVSVGDTAKCIFRCSSGVVSAFYNGVKIHTFTGVTMDFGKIQFGIPVTSPKIIRSLVFPAALTDAQCIELTTL